MKRKIYYFVKKYLAADIIKVIILLIPICVIVYRKVNNDKVDILDTIDISIIVSFGLVAICNTIAFVIKKHVDKKTEDFARLDFNEENLVKQYSLNKLYEYNGNKFPIILCANLKNKQLIVEDDCQKEYQTPKIIEDNYSRILSSYNASVIYNNRNIRVDDYIDKDNKFILKTSRTTYFQSLLTNRSCDFLIDKNITTRQIFEPGPYIKNLCDSKMSNHLGFNGFIITNDNKVPLILRNSNLSIGKRNLASTVEASLKVKYSVKENENNDFILTFNGIANSIINEIKDELGLKKINITNEDVLNNLVCFYRDLVECGKPQLMFILKLNVSSDEIEINLKEKIKKKTKESKVIRDGKKAIFVDVHDLIADEFDLHSTYVLNKKNNKKYKMMPSSAFSLSMLLTQLKENNF